MNSQEQINKDWNTLHDFDELISLLITRLQKRIPHLVDKPSAETKERLAVVETELKNIKDLILDLSQDFKDSFGRLPCGTHEKSIRVIENKMNYDKGVFATVMIFVGIASTIITSIIIGFLTKVLKF